jgi:hypothetical protein
MLGALVVSLAIVSAPPPIAASVDPLPFDPAAWQTAPQVELRVVERGKPIVYSGIPLASVLKDHLKGDNTMASLRALSDAVILVKATDGYQAAVSAAAAAMDPKGERYLLALRRDGKPLDERQGPVVLVIPGDPQHVRWVRMIQSLQLVRLSPSK